jgi:hypothetical protein
MQTENVSVAKPFSASTTKPLRDSLPSPITNPNTKDKFQECDTCWQNAVPVLCNGCLHNKQVIERHMRLITKYRFKLQKLLFAKGNKTD